MFLFFSKYTLLPFYTIFLCFFSQLFFNDIQLSVLYRLSAITQLIRINTTNFHLTIVTYIQTSFPFNISLCLSIVYNLSHCNYNFSFIYSNLCICIYNTHNFVFIQYLSLVVLILYTVTTTSIQFLLYHFIHGYCSLYM